MNTSREGDAETQSRPYESPAITAVGVATPGETRAQRAHALYKEHVTRLAKRLVAQGIPEEESEELAEHLIALGELRIARQRAMSAEFN